MKWFRHAAAVACLALAAWIAPAAMTEEAPEPVLKPGQFPATGGRYLSGELVLVDPVNRRGALRLDGDGTNRHYNGPLHYFAMLPYGMARYNGAPAELRDLPLGTHVHGYFHLPPVGEEATIPPVPKEMAEYEIPHNHALSLEDDFSFYQSRGQAWQVEAVDLARGKIHVAPTVQRDSGDGIRTPYTFDIDHVTRVWRQRALVDPEAIASGQIVQLNLGWSQGWRDREFTVSDIWLDEASRDFATELQRRRHVRFQRQRWLPGWIDHVEHNDYGGGIVTLTLFGGMDPSLYADLKETQGKGFGVAAAEKTLRTWFHRADKKIGQVLQWQESDQPPPGSSGIQIRLKFTELIEGYRPGRCVRVKSDRWAFVTMPPEERVKSVLDQQRSAVLGLPW